ncbi:MAG: GGDEF domain-containing protein [Thiotrichales bacterium]|nr:GGDEF domain-containing protein [Thiotrichales bacterium]
MIKVKDNAVQANKIYEKIAELFSNHAINPLPVNYLIWYHYFKGENLALISEMNSILKDPSHFTDRLGIRLYDQFVENEEIEIETQYDFAMRQFIDDIIQKLSNWKQSLKKHSDEMGACAEKINKANHQPKDLEEIANFIAQTALKMQSNSDLIQKEFQHSSDEVTLLRKQLNEAQAEMLKDELTQIGNRKAFNNALMDLTIQHQAKPNSLCLIMTDIDHFKGFNDTYGHPVGDSVLRYFSGIMRKTSTEKELLCRYGGEEFAVIIKDCSVEEAAQRAETIRKKIEEARLTLKDSEEPIRTITASFGIASYQGKEDNLADFIERADKNLYRAKEAGRNQICF